MEEEDAVEFDNEGNEVDSRGFPFAERKILGLGESKFDVLLPLSPLGLTVTSTRKKE